MTMLIHTLRDRLGAYLYYRKTRGELCKLSDRTLADIGITRGDIDRIAKMKRRDQTEFSLDVN